MEGHPAGRCVSFFLEFPLVRLFFREIIWRTTYVSTKCTWAWQTSQTSRELAPVEFIITYIAHATFTCINLWEVLTVYAKRARQRWSTMIMMVSVTMPHRQSNQRRPRSHPPWPLPARQQQQQQQQLLHRVHRRCPRLPRFSVQQGIRVHQ